MAAIANVVDCDVTNENGSEVFAVDVGERMACRGAAWCCAAVCGGGGGDVVLCRLEVKERTRSRPRSHKGRGGGKVERGTD